MLEKPLCYFMVTLALIAVIFTGWVKLGENPVTLVREEVAEVGINAADKAMEMADDAIHSKAVRKSARFIDKLFGTHVARHGVEWASEQTRAGHEETQAMVEKIDRWVRLKAFAWDLNWDNIIQKSPWQTILGTLLLGMLLYQLALREGDEWKSGSKVLLGLSAAVDARLGTWLVEYSNESVLLWLSVIVPAIGLIWINRKTFLPEKRTCQTCNKKTVGNNTHCNWCIFSGRGKSPAADEREGDAFCKNCGHSRSKGASFCGGCGARVPENPLTCPTCNATVDEGDNFCDNGHHLKAATESSTTSGPRPPSDRGDIPI